MKLWTIGYLLLATSCATTMLRKTYNLKILSDGSNDTVAIQNTRYPLPARVRVERSRQELHMILISDSLTRTYTVKAVLNPTFIYGNLGGVYFSLVGYIVDLTNSKRFSYGKKIYLHRLDTSAIIRPRLGPFPILGRYFNKTYLAEKGSINLLVSTPLVNTFYRKPPGESAKSATGFLGITVGMEYYYTPRRYLSINSGAAINFLAPVPAPVHREGVYEDFSSRWLGLTDNIVIKRFHLGYGLQYSWNTWQRSVSDISEFPITIPQDSRTRHSQALGVTVQAYHQISRFLLVGVVYRPTVLNIRPQTEFLYEHLISLDMAWKIQLRR